ncbi:MAG: N-6 DNA methylase [Leptospiraceae bacterium]|nr:N-6 DNA methylase [Leptospiraceae bacterium]MCP5493264.1 N-6 DNA methylase [Leptospiraceae bacterium]
MFTAYQPLFAENYLLSSWDAGFHNFSENVDKELLKKFENWASKEFQKETAAESTFVDIFFKQIWGYTASGELNAEEGYTCHSQYPIQKAGQKGGTGEADFALGYFGKNDIVSKIAQVLCEFKDIRSGLDESQNRKGNNRSPVKQCADYIKEVFSSLYGNEPVLPTWGIVTDMNEFRLYFRREIPYKYQKFVIQSNDSAETSLIERSENGQKKRFLFWKLFQSDMLLARHGKSELEKLLDKQWVLEREIENDFYLEYKEYRQKIFETILKYNPNFSGTKGKLVRLTQRFLDRCIFILFCEDMGAELHFPPNVLRDLLIKESVDEDYDPDDNVIWTRIKKLFASMRDGTPFRSHKINKFNGGLFEEEPELESLIIPTFLFCSKGQGINEETLLTDKFTLLYFSAKYNFGVTEKTHERSISLITLGRIFEQSITELEIMEAHADGKVSLSEISKRKRNGVYYTPEWVTKYIVEETIGKRLEEIRSEIGLNKNPEISKEEIDKYQNARRGKRQTHSFVQEYLSLLDIYSKRLDDIKVIDPACGSGAFLIQAFQFLLKERQWIADARERIEGHGSIFDSDKVIKSILSNNIYGIDINPESVEITRLAIWLHTAKADSTLCTLDKNIICGNTLISSGFYKENTDSSDGLFSESDFSEEEKEEINVLNLQEAFPDIFPSLPSTLRQAQCTATQQGGFDCVIGNPPYVKLQNFRKVQPEVSEYLLKQQKDGKPLYRSTQTGNFDLYLPFIEKGLELLHPKGKMGYIAPNVWLVNEYGRGLRSKLLETKQMDRWVDFKSFQVFEEAITYTALQFFTGSENEEIKCSFAFDGDISNIDWNETDSVSYQELQNADAWNFLPKAERKLLDRLNLECDRLEDSCKGITVGIQTSADYIYHLEKLAPNKYLYKTLDKKTLEVELEDEIMHPLVSGPDAKRYILPNPSTYLLFPYILENGKPRLHNKEEMENQFPKTWKYLKSYEKELRSREKGKFDDNEWYRFGRNQNIDKQEFPKLMVPRLVIHLFCVVDIEGQFYLDNVDVGGILLNKKDDIFYLAGILNSPVANFVWRRISKPFQNDYRSANKQFIAPLPIPKVTDEEKAKAGNLAKVLQELHTSRRDKLLMIDKRLSSSQTEEDKRTPSWLWADAQDKEKLDRKLESIDVYLQKGSKLKAETEYGELKFFINDRTIIQGIFEEEKEAEFICAEWNKFARETNVTEHFDVKKLLNGLLNLRKTTNLAIKDQVVKLDKEIIHLEKTILEKENEMNELTYRLYRLSKEEIKLVENG